MAWIMGHIIPAEVQNAIAWWMWKGAWARLSPIPFRISGRSRLVHPFRRIRSAGASALPCGPVARFLPIFSIAFAGRAATFARSIGIETKHVNSEFSKQALAKVGNPNVLINLVSRRVRQLNSGGGGLNRPLFSDTAGLGAADIALKEIIDDKMGWEMPEELQLIEPVRKKRKKG